MDIETVGSIKGAIEINAGIKCPATISIRQYSDSLSENKSNDSETKKPIPAFMSCQSDSVSPLYFELNGIPAGYYKIKILLDPTVARHDRAQQIIDSVKVVIDSATIIIAHLSVLRYSDHSYFVPDSLPLFIWTTNNENQSWKEDYVDTLRFHFQRNKSN